MHKRLAAAMEACDVWPYCQSEGLPILQLCALYCLTPARPSSASQSMNRGLPHKGPAGLSSCPFNLAGPAPPARGWGQAALH